MILKKFYFTNEIKYENPKRAKKELKFSALLIYSLVWRVSSTLELLKPTKFVKYIRIKEGSKCVWSFTVSLEVINKCITKKQYPYFNSIYENEGRHFLLQNNFSIFVYKGGLI